MRRSPLAPFIVIPVWIFLLAIGSTSSRAATEPVWDADEIVDMGPIEITSSSGPGILHNPDWSPWAGQDDWHVVYAKAGDIYHAVRTTAGWQTPEQLTADPAISKDPKLAFAREKMIVVWEDDRRGHPEIWSREWDGTAWGIEAAFADDSISSASPAITGEADLGYVVWEEGPAGQTRIVGREVGALGWGAVQVISTGSTTAIEPSIGYTVYGQFMLAAWSDGRHGANEIYIRARPEGGSWGNESRLTNLQGSSRKPSVFAQACCGDVFEPQAAIVYENDMTGVPEVWLGDAYRYGSHSGHRVSADDGIASTAPQMHGFELRYLEMLGGAYPRYPITWTEDGAPGQRVHVLAMSEFASEPMWTNVVTTSGLSTSNLASRRGDPMATVMATWLEEREGQTALIARKGAVTGCEGRDFTGPAAVLLSPGATSANIVTCTSACTGHEPIHGSAMAFRFDSVLNPQFTWDAVQAHPITQTVQTGIDGVAEIRIRGGGCYSGGRVSLLAHGVEVKSWTGAKSPDCDGDCRVTEEDLQYVMARLGTTQFCADLDGSGLVTLGDVMIVSDAMGTVCSQLTDVPATPALGTGFTIRPNPAIVGSQIVIKIAGAVPVRIEIFDAAGRLVRRIDSADRGGAGGDALWDGLDQSGRQVPPGLYYVRAAIERSRLTRAVVLLH